MASDFDRPPIYDIVTDRTKDNLSGVWADWWSTFFEVLVSYLTQYGIFIPRLTTAQRNSIITPQEGQIIFNTDIPAGQIFQGGVWVTFT